jgi:hypothetical protein
MGFASVGQPSTLRVVICPDASSASTAFVDYIFGDAATLVQGRASPEFVANALAAWKRRPQASVNVTMTRNSRDMLARYNRRVIEQCQERVYCSAKTSLVLGLTS